MSIKIPSSNGRLSMAPPIMGDGTDQLILNSKHKHAGTHAHFAGVRLAVRLASHTPHELPSRCLPGSSPLLEYDLEFAGDIEQRAERN